VVVVVAGALFPGLAIFHEREHPFRTQVGGGASGEDAEEAGKNAEVRVKR
jgi:hypothetical protein